MEFQHVRFLLAESVHKGDDARRGFIPQAFSILSFTAQALRTGTPLSCTVLNIDGGARLV
jgi:hypothetical protein